VVILRHFQNLSYDEMAKLLFCNRGTVTSRLFYARQQLKEILEREMGPSRDVAQPPSAGEGSPPRAGVPHAGPQKGGQML
jgi:hypothetical protein